MFDKIETAIITILQAHLHTIPPENIRAKRQSHEDTLPTISLYNVDFDVKEVGFGRSAGGVECREIFSGDAKTVEFLLRDKPLRPNITVEQPPGTRVAKKEYVTDYEKGRVTFNEPPAAAENNIVIKYVKPTQVKGLKLNLRYHLNIWAQDAVQRDALTIKVMEIMLSEEDHFNQQGIFITPMNGFNIPSTHNESTETYGKTIVYSIESRLEISVPLPRIEQIEIHHE
jgi:hypothetical protein